MDSEYDVKYPKSRNNFQCLGPCYEPGTFIIHPTTLEHVTDFKNPFCPVNEWEHINPTTGKKELAIHDTCFKPTDTTKISSKEVEMNIILPKIDFNCNHFLKIYYKIYSMEGMMDWLDKNGHLPYYTIRRIMDCAWKSYGMDNYIVDDRIILYYVKIAKTRWIHNIYKKIGKYVKFTDEKIQFSSKESEMAENSIEKINFIVDKLINPSTMSKFLTKYVEFYSNNTDTQMQSDSKNTTNVINEDNEISHTDIIKKEFIEYIEKKVLTVK